MILFTIFKKPNKLKKMKNYTLLIISCFILSCSVENDTKKNEIGLQIKNTGNTIIRTIFSFFKYEIETLDCVGIASLTKKDLPRGNWKHLSEKEISQLMML